jgi:hypothetical protein
MSRTLAFTREQLRAPFTLVLLIAVPTVFVVAAAGVLHDFARALGGSLAGNAAVGLSAGWAAAFLSGALGFFAASSSRGADRRLALAGLGPARVALSRIVASVVLATVAAAAAFVALEVQSGGVAHPWHAAIGVIAFAWMYLGVGVLVGSLVSDPLEGSLIVVFVFILDVFSGPGMAGAASPWAISRKAGDILIAAGLGRPSPAGDWIALGLTTAVAVAAAFVVFVVSARRRS